MVGIGLTIVGAFLAITCLKAGGAITLLGIIFAILSCLAYAGSEIVKKKTREFKNSLGAPELLFWSYLFAFPVMLFASYIFSGKFVFIWNLQIAAIVAISIASLLLSYKSLDFMPTSVSKSINNTSPVFVLMISMLLFGLPFPGIWSVIGILTAAGGVLLMSEVNGNGII